MSDLITIESATTMKELELALLETEQVECKVVHTFSKGIYVRELHIPKGALIVGKRHRKKTINMLIKGKMTIYDENESYVVEAPFIAEADSYTKKAGYAHEDSVWVNVHNTYETDLDIIEKDFIIPEKEYEKIMGYTHVSQITRGD